MTKHERGVPLDRKTRYRTPRPQIQSLEGGDAP